MNRTWACIGLQVVLLMPTAAFPQNVIANTDSVPQSVWAHAARNYWHVRLALPAGDTLEGRVRFLRREASVGGDPVPAAYLSLDRRLSRGRGMYLGAGVGFIVGAVMTGSVAGSSENVSESEVNLAALGGGAAGAMLGLLIGHLAMPARHEWVRIWPDE